jgi:hypothetical protein
MGMQTDGYLGIRQPCEYCPVLLNDVVYMHGEIWQGLEADRGVGVLW